MCLCSLQWAVQGFKYAGLIGAEREGENGCLPLRFSLFILITISALYSSSQCSGSGLHLCLLTASALLLTGTGQWWGKDCVGTPLGILAWLHQCNLTTLTSLPPCTAPVSGRYFQKAAVQYYPTPLSIPDIPENQRLVSFHWHEYQDLNSVSSTAVFYSKEQE